MVFEAVYPGVGSARLLPCLHLGLLPPVRPQPDRGPRAQNAQVGTSTNLKNSLTSNKKLSVETKGNIFALDFVST